MPEQLARYTVTLRDGRQVYKDLPASWDKAQVRAAFAQDMAAEGIDSRAQMVLDGPQGHSVSNYEPSLKEKAASLASVAFAPVAVDQHHANRIGGRLADLLDWSPVGAAFGIDEGAGELGRGLRNGDVAAGVSGLAMMALSGVPEARQGAKGIRGLLANEDGVIRAWHGSPHDFDKFSLSKIGTGEGAQAYGHGLYFAENRPTAEYYRDELSRLSRNGATSRALIVDGKQLSPQSPDYIPADLAKMAGQYRDDIIKDYGSVDNWARQDMVTRGIQDIDGAMSRFKELDGQNIGEQSFRGRLYEVNINAEPEDFLDWDAPLSGQPERVRSAAAHRLDQLTAHGAQLGPDPSGEFIWKAFNPQGGVDKFGFEISPSAYASKSILGSGIPGIKYLDQGSRGAGDGTRNYAVFDDSLIDILNKY